MFSKYPLHIEQQKDGSFFIDLPGIEGVTEGATMKEAIAEGLHCLITILRGYIQNREDIPPAPIIKPGQPVAILPPLMVVKLGLYQAMKDQGVTRVELAKQLGASENTVRRMLDLDHKSHIGSIVEALSILDKQVTVEVIDVI